MWISWLVARIDNQVLFAIYSGLCTKQAHTTTPEPPHRKKHPYSLKLPLHLHMLSTHKTLSRTEAKLVFITNGSQRLGRLELPTISVAQETQSLNLFRQ